MKALAIAVAVLIAQAASAGQQLDCLAEAVYFEARGEPISGQLAVAHVVLNRVSDPRWPNNMCSVVHQRYQFSYYWDGKPELIDDRQAYSAARMVALYAASGGIDITEGATHYHSLSVRPLWAKYLQRITTIEKHVFYR